MYSNEYKIHMIENVINAGRKRVLAAKQLWDVFKKHEQ